MIETLLDFPIASVVGFAFAAFLIELTPGPNMTYLALVGASHGRRFGIMTVLGVTLGLGIIGVAASLGVTTIIQSSELLYQLLRWAGVIFLFYLAWEGWHGEEDSEHGARITRTGFAYFRRGLITNLLNPKAAAFYVTVLPAFLPAQASVIHSLFLTAIYVAIATIIHIAVVLLASTLQPHLNNPKREKIVRRFLSVLLALVAIWFAIGTARD